MDILLYYSKITENRLAGNQSNDLLLSKFFGKKRVSLKA
jgi:hypothetical protein